MEIANIAPPTSGCETGSWDTGSWGGVSLGVGTQAECFISGTGKHLRPSPHSERELVQSSEAGVSIQTWGFVQTPSGEEKNN
ncbi:hypothetical protein TWF281_009261 [Arthrobotrys megalospora]